MEKVIILKKMQVTMKSYVPPFFYNFSLILNKKKSCGNEGLNKETKNNHALSC